MVKNRECNIEKEKVVRDIFLKCARYVPIKFKVLTEYMGEEKLETQTDGYAKLVWVTTTMVHPTPKCSTRFDSACAVLVKSIIQTSSSSAAATVSWYLQQCSHPMSSSSSCSRNNAKK